MTYINLNVRKRGDVEEDDDAMTDVQYIRKSSQLIAESLQRGFDVMQIGNGDIVITEVKTVNIKYVWNQKKRRFERVTTGRAKRTRETNKQTESISESHSANEKELVKVM